LYLNETFSILINSSPENTNTANQLVKPDNIHKWFTIWMDQKPKENTDLNKVSHDLLNACYL